MCCCFSFLIQAEAETWVEAEAADAIGAAPPSCFLR